ncbi:MAG TPA: hypothetical protein VGO93_09975 [Candidatus Xenobia bacterium]
MRWFFLVLLTALVFGGAPAWCDEPGGQCVFSSTDTVRVSLLQQTLAFYGITAQRIGSNGEVQALWVSPNDRLRSETVVSAVEESLDATSGGSNSTGGGGCGQL